MKDQTPKSSIVNQSKPVVTTPETCIKMQPQKSGRYSASPLGKRFDIYETSETEEPDPAL